MSNTFVDNTNRWLSLAEPDFLILFVKSWIPFNAWYKGAFSNLVTDRDILNEIKSTSNVFKNKIHSLLENDSDEGKLFRNHIAQLHQALEDNIIPNLDNRISFRSIVVETNPLLSKLIEKRSWKYKAEIVYSGPTNYTVNSLITGSDGSTKFTKTQNKYDISFLTSELIATNLSDYQQSNMLKAYDEINPRKPTNLIPTSNRHRIQVGSIFLVEDLDKVSKGIIEILYRLRCILFHGELNPTNNHELVFEKAFYILRMLIQSLR